MSSPHIVDTNCFLFLILCNIIRYDYLTNLHTYKNGGFRYYSFLLTVPAEFEPKLNGEAQDYRWVEINDLPAPLHYGFKELLPKLQNYLLKNSK